MVPIPHEESKRGRIEEDQNGQCSTQAQAFCGLGGALAIPGLRLDGTHSAIIYTMDQNGQWSAQAQAFTGLGGALAI